MSNQQVNQSVPKHDDGLQADQFDENILVFDNIFSRGYGFSPQVLTRLPQLSIEAKGLYSYFSSFAGQGGVAFPSTQTILKETNISKNRFSQACRINKLAFEGQSDVSKLDVASNLLVASQ